MVWYEANTSSIIYHENGQLVPLVVFAPYHHFLSVNHKLLPLFASQLGAFVASGACAFVFVLFVSAVLVLVLLSEHAISVIGFHFGSVAFYVMLCVIVCAMSVLVGCL